MTGTPEWIAIVAPFASGFFGVGMAWGIIRQHMNDIERRVIRNENKLESQVGEARCDKMRDDCQKDFKSEFTGLSCEVKRNRDHVSAKFEEIAKFMGKLNGKIS